MVKRIRVRPCPDCGTFEHENVRGLCYPCYRRRKSRGQALPPSMRTAEGLLEASCGSADECWPYVGTINDEGYGRFSQTYAHRMAWEQLHGSIPDGLKIDHICHTNDPDCFAGVGCRHRRCVNPAHMELVDLLENTRRAHRRVHDACKRGHPYVGANDRRGSRGTRICVICRRGDKPAAWRNNEYCRNGHELTPDNIRLDQGSRRCRTCRNAQRRRRHAARRIEE